jgi:hypothetical protein
MQLLKIEMNLKIIEHNIVIYIHPLYQSLWLNNYIISIKKIKDLQL